MENKVLINLADVNELKAFYGMLTEDIVKLISDNINILDTPCPSYCDLKELMIQLKGY